MAELNPADSDVNRTFVDRWSWVHALNGAAAGLFGLSPPVALGGAVAYEIVEYAHEWPHGSTLFGSKYPESWQNLTGDLLLYGGCYFAARRLSAEPYAKAAGAGAAVLATALAIAFTPKVRPQATALRF